MPLALFELLLYAQSVTLYHGTAALSLIQCAESPELQDATQPLLGGARAREPA
jgi:hypothetical protein